MKKVISLGLIVAVLLSMSVSVMATDAPVQQETIVLSAAETAVLQELGMEMENVVSVSHVEAYISDANEDENTSVEILQVVSEDEDGLIASTSVMLLDEEGAPLSASSISDYGIVSPPTTGPINYMSATVRYRMYADVMEGVFVNPRSVTLRSTVACNNVNVNYVASGPCYRMSGTSPVYVSGSMNAIISASYSSMTANTNYTASGYSFYNGYAISQDCAICISNLGSSENHGVTATYYTASGTYYMTSFPFSVNNT